MKILVLGNDETTLAISREIIEDGRHQILMTYPATWDLPGTDDLEAALATSGVDAVLVGGSMTDREEWLRRSAGQGWTCFCLHPPGANTDPYYQVALSNHEFRAVIVPDLPLRFHPAIEAIRKMTSAGGELGQIRSIVLDVAVTPGSQSLILDPFSKWVDVIRVLLGEVENIAAMGYPAGTQPTERLTTQLRCAGDRRAEITLRAVSQPEPVRMTVIAGENKVYVEFDPEHENPGELTIQSKTTETVTDESAILRKISLPVWNRYKAMIQAWGRASDRSIVAEPGLLDGIRSMEVAEGAIRSLRRGRAIDLYYEEVSEANNFKTIMTSVGCMMVVGILMALPLIMAGPALGLPFTLYLGYLIPVVLSVFALLQLLKLAIKSG